MERVLVACPCISSLGGPWTCVCALHTGLYAHHLVMVLCVGLVAAVLVCPSICICRGELGQVATDRQLCGAQYLWFRHTFVLTAGQSAELRGLAVAALADRKLEVGELAASTLSGMLKVGLIIGFMEGSPP